MHTEGCREVLITGNRLIQGKKKKEYAWDDVFGPLGLLRDHRMHTEATPFSAFIGFFDSERCHIPEKGQQEDAVFIQAHMSTTLTSRQNTVINI